MPTPVPPLLGALLSGMGQMFGRGGGGAIRLQHGRALEGAGPCRRPCLGRVEIVRNVAFFGLPDAPPHCLMASTALEFLLVVCWTGSFFGCLIRRPSDSVCISNSPMAGGASGLAN